VRCGVGIAGPFTRRSATPSTRRRRRDRNDDACGDPEGIKYARCGSPVSPLQFHIYEFWAGFLFACIEATSLIFTPRALATVSKRPGLLRTVLMFDIMSTFIAAILVTFNLDVFEVPAHEIEFSNELTLAPVWKSTSVSGAQASHERAVKFDFHTGWH